jgi:hypothetical protein
MRPPFASFWKKIKGPPPSANVLRICRPWPLRTAGLLNRQCRSQNDPLPIMPAGCGPARYLRELAMNGSALAAAGCSSYCGRKANHRMSSNRE